MNLIKLFALLLLPIANLASDSDTKTATAVILCYPTDKLISYACDEIERRLNQCQTAKIKVVRKDNLDKATLSTVLSEDKVPPHTPVFVVGHGSADYDHNFYIATKLFWKDHPEKVKPEAFPRLVEEGNLLPGKLLNSGITKSISDPALWYLSCHSGGNCTDGGNIGASCSSWETSAISQFNSLIKFNLKLDPATRKLLSVLCNPGEFEKSDKDSNGYIEREEWLSVFHSDFEKSVALSHEKDGSKTNSETKERVLKQLSPHSEFSEKNGVLNLTLRNCVNSASPLSSPFLATPVLHHFSLPNWEQQTKPAQTQLHQKPTPNH